MNRYKTFAERIKNIDIWTFVSIGLLLLFGLFLCYPLLKIVRQAFFSSEGNFTFANFLQFFSQKYYFATLVNSFKVGIFVTLRFFPY